MLGTFFLRLKLPLEGFILVKIIRNFKNTCLAGFKHIHTHTLYTHTTPNLLFMPTKSVLSLPLFPFIFSLSLFPSPSFPSFLFPSFSPSIFCYSSKDIKKKSFVTRLLYGIENASGINLVYWLYSNTKSC